MAKLKKHKKHRKRKILRLKTSALNRHHLLWERKMWNSGSLRELREFYYCKVNIPRDTLHKEIHERVPFVPTPNPKYAKFVLNELKHLDEIGAIREDDSVEKRLGVLICYFDCIEQKTASALWEQLKIVREYNDEPSD